MTKFRNSVIIILVLAGIILAALPNFSSPETEWSKTDPSLNITHIFMGDINSRGKPVGFHVAPKTDGYPHARIKQTLSGPNKAGVYTAMIEIFDPETSRWKEKFSSIFPEKLTKQQIIDAILSAFKNNRLPQGAKWQGRSGRGFLIEGYTLKNGTVNTAYPIYVAD
ncbi:MAG: hypothetical protein COB93_06665 [Sneathiella sp.]|nr:MAG: hypothetical protein COB93_06665 [Sneathiella sp.]